jgi:hypothetical protein
MKPTVGILLIGGIGILAVVTFSIGNRLTEHPHDTPRPQPISCVNNLKQIGISFRTWAIEHDDLYPCNVHTNKGGVLELCSIGTDGFDQNPTPTFQVMSNELTTPLILLCPKDRSKNSALNFSKLTSSNITYRLRSGADIRDANATNVLMLCPICGNILRCDGSVTIVTDDR